jgi:general L-amino acid transport system permease protein
MTGPPRPPRAAGTDSIARMANANLRRHPFGVLLWVLVILGAVAVLPGAIRWALIDATWVASDRTGCNPDGACWAFILARLPQFAFGFFPPEERWRPVVALFTPIVALGIALGPRFAGKNRIVATAFALYPLGATILLSGTLVGLEPVASSQWGGMTMTVYIGTTAFVLAFPIAMILALARRSRLVVVHMCATAFIEFWRGLPLIAILFIAVVMLPLMLPAGVTLPRLAFAIAGMTIYISSYLAEVFRGGLQSLGKGQYEAAAAAGFSFWPAQIYIIWPQALRAVLPGILNTVVALFKDTTFVLVVGLFDFLNIVNAAIADPKWLGLATEGYLFVAIVYWCFNFLLSRVSANLERQMARGRVVAAKT